MNVDQAFFEQGFRLAGEAVLAAVAKAGLHLRPERLSRAAARRCRVSFRQIAAIVRRLIFLMALQIELPPPRPRGRAPAVMPAQMLEGVEDVTASFGPQPRGLALSPPKGRPPVPDSIKGPFGVHKGSDVLPGPLLARWAALYRVLDDPARHARRLAASIRRWRQAGEAAPVCLPLGFERRLPAELGLVARVLPQLIGKAIHPWTDTS